MTESRRKLAANIEAPAADWRPTAGHEALRARADMLAACRQFFAQRQVLEVETPLWSAAATTDNAIDSVEVCGETNTSGYLATSPEFPMKRLLASGSGDIYQICKAFRRGERGALHNPEFTLLEWYRLGFDLEALMAEVALLLETLLQRPGLSRRARYVSYRDLFRECLDVDPLNTNAPQLRAILVAHKVSVPLPLVATRNDSAAARDELLDLAMSTVILSSLDPSQLVFIFDYPVSQAALARAHEQNPSLARRFEVVLGGCELANGFEELRDAAEQQQRFERDLQKRRRAGRRVVPMDQRLLAALAHGLPDCAGVALGLDRALMLVTGATAIDEILAFPAERA